ncbi:MAG: hypothetical protein WA761_07415 [Thermoplasmata archaeon]
MSPGPSVVTPLETLLPCWEFRSDARALPAAERDGLTSQLLTHLSTAVGLDVPFGFDWETGSAPCVRAWSLTLTGWAWLRTLLERGYQAGQWVEAPGPTPPGPQDRRRLGVCSRYDPPVPASAPIPGRIADPILATLPLLPEGICFSWELRPVGRSRKGSSREAPRTETAAPATGPGGLPRGPTPRRYPMPSADPPVWTARITIHALRTLGPRSLDAAVRALHRGLEPAGGSVRFVRPIGLLRDRPALFPLSTHDLVALFPSVATPFPGRPQVIDPDGLELPLGRTALGAMVRLPVPANEGRHVAVVGETGMGKSSALLQAGGWAIHHGNVILLDPIGDTARRFVRGLSRTDRDRLLLVSPSDSPRGINALETPSDGHVGASERHIADLVHALRRVRASRYGETPFWGPRIEEVVHTALRVASACPGATLVEAQRWLEDDPPSVQDLPGPVRPLAHALHRKARERPEEVEGARRLLDELNRVPVLRQLLCSPSPGWRIADAVSPGRITVISGDIEEIGEAAARYLLAVYLALIWSALLSAPVRARHFLLLDELQWFGHESIAEALRVGRRLDLHIWATTQALGSLNEVVREALVTNASDLIVFRGSPEDAREFGRWTGRLTPDRLLGLHPGEAVWMGGKGHRIEWLRFPRPAGAPVERPTSTPAVTDPPPDPRRRLLGALAVGLSRVAPAGADLTVHLSDLRTLDGVPNDALRQVGAGLGQRGLLLSTGKDGEGTYWVLRAVPGSVLPEPPPTSTERAAFEADWAQISRRRRGSSSH